MSTNIFDVAIIGGGAAGLSAALTLGRSLRSVVVFDAGQPRNAPAAGAHNLLGNEGIAPGQLLATGRAEVVAYGVDIRSTEVSAIERVANGDFVIRTAGTEITATTTGEAAEPVTARRLLLATGLVDELPDIPGVAELWGSQVLHCPYCHGYEVRGKRIGVLGSSPMSMHQAMLFRQLSDNVTLFSHAMPSLTPEELQQLSALGIGLVDAKVTGLDVEGGSLRGVALGDGTTVECDAVVVAPRFVVRSDLYTDLGGTLVDHPMGPMIPADPMGATGVPGVWAAGNNANLSAMVSVAMGAGVMAGAAINADLVATDARLAMV